jgi:predicted membrane channel-forming protein YqfA (hemolysin III family)
MDILFYFFVIFTILSIFCYQSIYYESSEKFELTVYIVLGCDMLVLNPKILFNFFPEHLFVVLGW